MAAPEIRCFQPADIEGALALWRRTEGVGLSDADRPEALGAFLERNPGLSQVALADGRLAGTVLCGTDGRRGYLHHLAVEAASRRAGIGCALVAAALAALAQVGIRKCHAFVFRDNLLGALFWERAGWERREDLVVHSKPI